MSLLERRKRRDYSVFPTARPVKKAYLTERAAGGVWGCSMSSWDEEMFTMMGGLAVFAVFCIGALLWLV